MKLSRKPRKDSNQSFKNMKNRLTAISSIFRKHLAIKNRKENLIKSFIAVSLSLILIILNYSLSYRRMLTFYTFVKSLSAKLLSMWF